MITVIIPHLNDRYIGDTLASIYKQEKWFTSRCDNAINKIIVTDVDRKGASWARNEGMKRDKYLEPYYFFCDDDVVLEEKALWEMWQVLKNNPKYGFVYCNFIHGKKKHTAGKWDYDKLCCNNYINTMSLIRRNVMLEWDEELERFQDWDLFLRIGKKHPGIWLDKTLFTMADSKENNGISSQNNLEYWKKIVQARL